MVAPWTSFVAAFAVFIVFLLHMLAVEGLEVVLNDVHRGEANLLALCKLLCRRGFGKLYVCVDDDLRTFTRD